MGRSVLVVAAHPDDEVVGAGGTIAKHARAGDAVHVLFVTDGSRGDDDAGRSRRANARRCADRLGVEACHFGGFPDTELREVPHRELNGAIEERIRAVRPDVVYTHSADELHQDHLAVHESTLVATRPGSGVETVLAYEIPTSTDRGSTSAGFQPTTSVDIHGVLETKVEALVEHDGETHEFPHPRSAEFVRHHARSRGGRAGYPAAEVFELLAHRVEDIAKI
jgi:LmbE family N-acetylglucosaminyl deacetylase